MKSVLWLIVSLAAAALSIIGIRMDYANNHPVAFILGCSTLTFWVLNIVGLWLGWRRRRSKITDVF